MKQINTYANNLSRVVKSNDYDRIIEHVAKYGLPTEHEETILATRTAVDVTRCGLDGHAVNALMQVNARFVAADGWIETGLPRCALSDLFRFASRAQSRKLEALKLLYSVFEYEKLKTERRGDQVIPIADPEAWRLKKLIELELKTNRRVLKENFGIKISTPKMVILLIVLFMFQTAKSLVA